MPTQHCRRNLERPFHASAALLFNSGFDANLGLASVLHPDNAIRAAIYASIQDIMRASRFNPALRQAFSHDTCTLFSAALLALRFEGIMLIRAMLDATDEVFPLSNEHVFVHEVHATGIWYGPGGCRVVAVLRLEDCRSIYLARPR
jgi:8-amino-7-oxononanoate synthase